MAVNTLNGQQVTYGLKNDKGAASVPAGTYLAKADAEWKIEDDNGVIYTIGEGTSELAVSSRISSVNQGHAPRPTVWKEYAQDNVITSPLGLVYDGAKWVTANEASAFASSTDGKTWSPLASLATNMDALPELRWSQLATIYDNEAITFDESPEAGDLLIMYGTGYATSSYLYAGTVLGTELLNSINTSVDYAIKVEYKIADGTETGTSNINMQQRSGGFVVFCIKAGTYEVDGGGLPVINYRWSQFNDNGNASTPVTWPNTNAAVSYGSLILAAGASENGNFTTVTVPDRFEFLGVLDDPSGDGFAVAASATAGVEDNGENFTVGAISGIDWVNNRNTAITFWVDPANTPEPITAFTYDGTDFYAFNPVENAMGVAANPPVSWDYTGYTYSINSNATVQYLGYVYDNSASTGDRDRAFTYSGTLDTDSMAAGDLAVLIVSGYAYTTGDYDYIESFGYTQVGANGNMSQAYQAIYSKTLTAEDIANGRWPIRRVYNNSSSYAQVTTLHVFKNAGGLTINGQSFGTTNLIDFPSRDLYAGSYNFLAISQEVQNTSTTAYPTDYSLVSDLLGNSTYDVSQLIIQKPITADGAEDPGQWILTTSDGTYGHAIAIEPALRPTITKMYHGGGKYFGFGGDFMTSSDGSAWELVASPFGGTVEAVIHTGSRFIIAGTNGQIATSTAGTTWTLRSSGLVNDIKDIKYVSEEGTYLAISSAGEVTKSTTGTSWEAIGEVASVKATSTAEAVEVVEIFGHAPDVANGQFRQTYDYPDSAIADDVIVLTISWNANTGETWEPRFLDESWTLTFARDSDSDLGTNDQKTQYVYYRRVTESDSRRFILETIREFTYDTSDNATYPPTLTIVGAVVRNVADPSAMKIAHRRTTTSSSDAFPADLGLIEEAHTQLAISASIGSLDSVPAPNTTAGYWIGYDDMTSYNNGSGSWMAASKQFPDGGQGETNYWRNASDAISENSSGVTSVTIAFFPPESVSSGASEPVMVSSTVSYPYVVGLYDTGSAVVTSAVDGTSTYITDLPFETEGFAAGFMVGKQGFAVTSNNNSVSVGKPFELLQLEPQKGLVYANG